VRVLPGVRSGREEAFRRLGVERLGDLLRLAPRRYEDRRHPVPVADLEEGQTALVIGRVVSSKSFRTRSGVSILEAQIEDDSGTAVARWFYRGFKPAPLGEDRRVALYGAVKGHTKGRPEFKSPELERLDAAAGDDSGVGRFVPVHPRTAGLTAAAVRRAVWHALPAADAVPDPVPPDVRAAFDPTCGPRSISGRSGRRCARCTSPTASRRRSAPGVASPSTSCSSTSCCSRAGAANARVSARPPAVSPRRCVRVSTRACRSS
jgi:RecG-like helicase